MRLWSIHPSYLDRQGLLAVWREGLLAQKVLLQGKCKKCFQCNGAGEYKYYNEKIKNKIIEKCKKCKGTGKIKTPYYNHPQLFRFKQHPRDIEMISYYLWEIWKESKERGYKFNNGKINKWCDYFHHGRNLTVTTGQLEYEFNHLQRKLYKREPHKYHENWNNMKVSYIKPNDYGNGHLRKGRLTKPYLEVKPHPLFNIVEGDIEKWEKVK